MVTYGAAARLSAGGRGVGLETTRARGASRPTAARGFLSAYAAGCFVSVPPPRGEGDRGQALWGPSWTLRGRQQPGGFGAPEDGAAGRNWGAAERGGSPQPGRNPLGSGLVPRREGVGHPRDVRGPVPAPSPALLLLCSLPETQAFAQTERAGRSQGPEREWGAR